MTLVDRTDTVARYLTLTRETLPRMAQDPSRRWPVRNDHCFQRIVLDHVSGGVWYNHIARPAYKHLSAEQANQAVRLCEAIMSGEADLHQMNRQSLAWRGKLNRPKGGCDAAPHVP